MITEKIYSASGKVRADLTETDGGIVQVKFWERITSDRRSGEKGAIWKLTSQGEVDESIKLVRVHIQRLLEFD